MLLSHLFLPFHLKNLLFFEQTVLMSSRNDIYQKISWGHLQYISFYLKNNILVFKVSIMYNIFLLCPCLSPSLHSQTPYIIWLWFWFTCVKWWYLGVFIVSKFWFLVFRVVIGQKMTYNYRIQSVALFTCFRNCRSSRYLVHRCK